MTKRGKRWRVWLFVHKDITFKINGQKDRTATSRVKDMNVRNNKPQIGSRNSRKKFFQCTVMPVISNNAIDKTNI